MQTFELTLIDDYNETEDRIYLSHPNKTKKKFLDDVDLATKMIIDNLPVAEIYEIKPDCFLDPPELRLLIVDSLVGNFGYTKTESIKVKLVFETSNALSNKWSNKEGEEFLAEALLNFNRYADDDLAYILAGLNKKPIFDYNLKVLEETRKDTINTLTKAIVAPVLRSEIANLLNIGVLQLNKYWEKLDFNIKKQIYQTIAETPYNESKIQKIEIILKTNGLI